MTTVAPPPHTPARRASRRIVGDVILWVAGLLSGAVAHASEPLKLAVSRTPLSLPFYVAQEKGYFAAEGLNVQISECLGGVRCLQGVFDGRADLATASEMPVVFNGFDRADYAVVATFVSTSDDLKMIVRTDGGTDRPDQLAGKRIGMVAGSSSQYFLDLYLFTAGVDPRTVNVVAMQPEELVEALRAGRVDAIAIWEPYGWMASRALGKLVRVWPNAGGYIETFNLVASRRLLPARDAELARLMIAIERAESLIQQQPDAAKAILRQRLQLDQAFVDWVWPGLGYRLGLDPSLVATMESEARWALREGHIRGKTSPNYLKFVHAAPLASVKPTAVGIKP